MRSRQLFWVTERDTVSMELDGPDVILRIGALQITLPRDRMGELTRPRESTIGPDCGSLSEALKAARLANQMTLGVAADRLEVSVNTVWRWEHGVHVPSRAYLYRLARFYKVSYGSLTALADRAQDRP